MHVLLTGAFGNLGLNTLHHLLAQGHSVTCLDLDNPRNRKVAAGIDGNIRIVWGDITKADSVREAVRGCDAIVHHAAMLPPATDLFPEKAWQVNVEATQLLARTLAASKPDGVFVYPSSLTVFGVTQDREPPRKVTERVAPSDEYTRAKVACEEMLQASKINYVILRVGVAISVDHSKAGLDVLRSQFAVRPDNRLEFVHPDDVALACANALTRPAAWRNIWLIGGGKTCQIHQRDMINGVFGAAGFRFDDSAFGNEAFYTDWLDTSESQRVLQFQQHSWQQFTADAAHQLRWVRRLLWPLRLPLNWLVKKVLSPTS
ncbi:MAG: NAD(P)-dependent oxidoreductase [Gammaproteobacteria bacterium]|nr:MAG: NAD(P)-dependent oxidoreductase [Gammaproteobacteria bacterium]